MGHLDLSFHDMEYRLSDEQTLGHFAPLYQMPSAESHGQIAQIQALLEYLPRREADFFSLYYFRNVNQTSISEIFGVSQPTVCYRLQRAAMRLRFLLRRPTFTEEEVRAALVQALSDPLDVDIMVLMWQTTCQSAAAKSLGITQGKVRHRFIRSIKALHEHEGLQEFASMFSDISENLNILREVCRAPR